MLVDEGGLLSIDAGGCDYADGARVQSIKALDERTVEFTLCAPDPDFLSKIAFGVFAIQDSDYLNENGGDSVAMSENPNGTGPYRVVEWRRGEQITYEAFDGYWGDAAQTPQLILRWNADSAAKFLALQAGETDGIDNPSPLDLEAAQADPNLQVLPREGLNIFYIGFNNTIAPFDNGDVRRAIALALDRQRIVDNFYPSGSEVAQQFVPPSFSPGFSTSGDGATWYETNVDEARTLLESTGIDLTAEYPLYYRNVARGYLPEAPPVAEEIRAQLADIGLTIVPTEVESTEFLDRSAAGELGFYLLGWGADYPAATNFYDYHFGNANNDQFGERYEELFNTILSAGQISDNAERQTLYDQVNTLIKENIPMVPVAHGGSAVVFQASVEGAHTSALGNELFYAMNSGKDTLTFTQNGEPGALWCADETDGESLRACAQYAEPLYGYEIGGVSVRPILAESVEPNADGTVWTFTLREGVTFHDGATLDANDVVATFEAQWNAASPNHVGRTGNFEYWGAFFGAQLNVPAE
jgi:ABC-type transport system substrate-binding protein